MHLWLYRQLRLELTGPRQKVNPQRLFLNKQPCSCIAVQKWSSLNCFAQTFTTSYSYSMSTVRFTFNVTREKAFRIRTNNAIYWMGYWTVNQPKSNKQHDNNAWRHGGAVVSTAASQREGPEFKSPSWLVQGLSVWSLHVLLVSVWVLSGFSSFLPQSKDMQHDRLTGVSGCLSLQVRLHGHFSSFRLNSFRMSLSG